MRTLIPIACALVLGGCVTPVFNLYPNPPGAFVGVPAIPVEVGVQLRQSRSLRQARVQYGDKLNQIQRTLADDPGSAEHPGLKAMLQGK